MLRVLTLALTLLIAAPASAAPFGELPFRSEAAGAACLRATGAPGELAAWAPGGIRLLQASASGLAPAAVSPLGRTAGCPAVAAQPNGAGVAAAIVVPAARSRRLRIVLREPGGAWGAPGDVAIPKGVSAGARWRPRSSPRGDAIVAWRGGASGRDLLPCRPPGRGGALGAPETLTKAFEAASFSTAVEVAVGADGTAVALWADAVTHGHFEQGRALAAIGAPGAPFGAAQLLAEGVDAAPALALAPDGRALALLPSSQSMRFAERPPGGAFGASQTLCGSAGYSIGAAGRTCSPTARRSSPGRAAPPAASRTRGVPRPGRSDRRSASSEVPRTRYGGSGSGTTGDDGPGRPSDFDAGPACARSSRPTAAPC